VYPWGISDPTLATNTPMTAVASSGAEEPAAMKVAPATSGDSIRANNTREKWLIKITTFIRYQLGRAFISQNVLIIIRVPKIKYPNIKDPNIRAFNIEVIISFNIKFIFSI
jgi:hypothetical protein